MSEDKPALSIGAVLGDSDPVNRAWKREINALSRKVEEISAGVSTPLRVNVIYHVDGRLAPNEFAGTRTGYFNASTNLLIVQAAISGEPPEDQEGVLYSLLQDAVAEAEDFARSKKLADDLSEVRELLERVRESGS